MRAWTLKVELWLMAIGRWPLVFGAAGVLMALLWGTLLPATEQQAAREHRRLQTLRERTLDRPVQTEAAPADTLAAFEARLASANDVTSLMRQLWEQGAAAGLQMNKVDYRTEPDTGGGFERLSVTLPMTGPYPAVRKFTFALMAEFPGLSLDKLDMKRDQAVSGRVETTAHFTLLTRP